MFCEQASELFAAGRITNGVVESAASHTARRCSDARAKRIHCLHRQFKTVPFTSNHVFSRHATRIECNLADWMRRDQRCALDDTKSLHLCADHKGRELGAAIRACARFGEDCVEIWHAGIGNEALATVDYVRLTVATSGRLNRRNVRTRVWLGERKGGD